jgi:UDP-N-acetylglucosamine--N-acetylmuramyl-(pentapeptide) pyrophosphoryl-undecaprenol N-acetylglucosamine transferase
VNRPVILIAGGGTGGHVFPGLAVADALTGLADVEVVFGGSPRGIEKDVVPPRGYRLELLDVSPIKGGGLSRAAKGAWIAARATVRALSVVRSLSPRAVLSVGGYAAGPFSLAAALARAPLAILEPNGVMGFTNRVLAPVAKRAYLAWPHLEARAKKGAARVVGVPLRKGFEPSVYVTKKPLQVLVMGGSQGAEALNERVPRALAAVARSIDLSVLHQTGKGRDQAVRATYAELGVRNAVVSEFLQDVPIQLTAADLVLARSGAGTVAEVAAVGRASILVPFPFAADDHQAANARALEQQGGCVCLLQADATVDRLEREIRALLSDDQARVKMADAARGAGKPHAARDVAIDLLALAGIPLRLAARGQNGKGKGLNGTERPRV